MTRRLILPGFLLLLGAGYLASNIVALKRERDTARIEPVATGVPPQSARVILVVLDGVPVRVAFDRAIMPNLVGLANRGSHGVLRAPEPTTTTVGVRALATGTTPTPADVLDMFGSAEFKGWTVFDDLVGRGESVSLVGERVWTALLQSRDSLSSAIAQNDTRLYEDPTKVLDLAMERLRSPKPPALSVVHLSMTDELGHRHGTTGPVYEAAMRGVDEALGRFLTEVIDDSTTILITADHGADIYGGHGGEGDVYRNVPVIMFGHAIRARAGVSMDARAIPGIVAILLGTRMPGGAHAVLPVDVLDVPDTLRARIAAANATQLEAQAKARNVPLPSTVAADLTRIESLARGDAKGALRLAEATLPTVAEALDQYSRPNPMRLAWVVVILGAVALGAVWTLSSSTDDDPMASASLAVAVVLVGVSVLFPRTATVALSTIAAAELALIGLYVRRMRRRVLWLGLTASLGVFALPAIRFAFGAPIKQALQARGTRVAVLLAMAVAVCALFIPRARAALKKIGTSSTLAIALFLLAVALLAPFSAVPVILIAATVLALSASLDWPALGISGLGLATFFYFGEKAADSVAHESLGPWYFLIGMALVILAAIWRKISNGRGSQLWWIWAGVLWLLPFGHIRLPATAGSPLISALSVMVAIGVAVALAAGRVRDWWCYLPLVATIAYQATRTHAVFWVGVAVHAGVLIANTTTRRPFASRQSVVILTAISALILMSPPADAMSAILLVVGLAAVARLEAANLPPSALALLGAAVVVYARYAFVDIFAHTAVPDCTLRCIDEASGFLGFNEIRWTWASVLVGLKMLIATVAVYAIVWSNPKLAQVRLLTLVASMLLVMTFIGKSALEAGLSFGHFGARLADSLSHAGFHTLMLFALGLGYVLYRLVTPASPAAKQILAIPTGQVSDEAA